jgi:sugar O-acyltransferase (sialic acid O-acetyltransferase NeuD family)
MGDTVSTDFVIVGAGGFGHELHDWINLYRSKGEFRGFIADDLSKDGVISTIDSWEGAGIDCYCGVGSGVGRKKIFDKFKDRSNFFSSLISPISQVAKSSNLGTGMILLGNSSVAANTIIGEGCLIQGFSAIGHDVVCGKFVSIYSFVFIGGGVHIGDGVSLYPHAVVLPGIKIGPNSVIGAGSVVISDVPENVTVFGNPAKIIKRNES